MDKNSLIVLGFLLLCILLSIDKKEGFATIDINSFESTCNTDSSTCIVNVRGAMGQNCTHPTDENLYRLSPPEGETLDYHEETFNIVVDGCSDAGYELDGVQLSSNVCSSGGEPYSLYGCGAKCTKAGSYPGYIMTGGFPNYAEPGDPRAISPDEGRCDTDQMVPATNACFNPDGSRNGAQTSVDCRNAGGTWYGPDGDNIKIVCNTDISPNYSIIGCESACLSRNTADQEYRTTSDLSNPNKEIIQILHRTGDPETPIEVRMPDNNATPYTMTEDHLNPGSFDVTGTASPINFSGLVGDPVMVEFEGDVGEVVAGEDSQREVVPCNLSSPNTDLQRKYPVSGLFPACDSSTHECLNFNITYDDVPMDKMDIDHFKSTMDTSAGEIGIPDNELDNYKNSLYYYRRYKDTNDKVHIEGQIRCNNDPSSPFHCIITDPTSDSPWYWRPLPSGRENRHSSTDPSIPHSDHSRGVPFITCERVCQEAGLQCTSGEIPVQDIPAGDTYETKMRNIINRLNLVDPGGDLPMNKPDADPAGLNFNNYDDLCSSHSSNPASVAAPSDSAFIEDTEHAHFHAHYSSIISNREGQSVEENQKLPFGIINGPGTGLGVGHSCLVTQQIGPDGTFVGDPESPETFTQSCGGGNLVALASPAGTPERDRRIDRTQSGWISDVMGHGRDIGQSYALVQKWSPICHCSPE